MAKVWPKEGSKFWKVLINPQSIAEEIKNFSKVTKFRRIWSHCSDREFAESQQKMKPLENFWLKIV